jgi:hypothetical protein
MRKAVDGRGTDGKRKFWFEAIDDPGAGQMQWLKKLILSRPFFERIPDQGLIAGENGTRYNYVAGTRGKSYAFLYTCTGRPFTVQMGRISGSEVRAWWYDPRTGRATGAGTFPNKGTREFDPPGVTQAGNDWVLVLDDASRHSASPAM